MHIFGLDMSSQQHRCTSSLHPLCAASRHRCSASRIRLRSLSFFVVMEVFAPHSFDAFASSHVRRSSTVSISINTGRLVASTWTCVHLVASFITSDANDDVSDSVVGIEALLRALDRTASRTPSVLHCTPSKRLRSAVSVLVLSHVVSSREYSPGGVLHVAAASAARVLMRTGVFARG